jgi:hypothetical protein
MLLLNRIGQVEKVMSTEEREREIYPHRWMDGWIDRWRERERCVR